MNYKIYINSQSNLSKKFKGCKMWAQVNQRVDYKLKEIQITTCAEFVNVQIDTSSMQQLMKPMLEAIQNEVQRLQLVDSVYQRVDYKFKKI